VITQAGTIAREEEKINALLDEGLEVLHIRKPSASKEVYVDLLDAIKPQYHCRIKIHAYFELADDYNLLGVHLNSRYPQYTGKRKVSLSKSCHAIEELNDLSVYDYVFLSPIFDSISKKDYLAGFDRRTLTSASEKGIINEKVIALGGIDERRLAQLRSYAFGGAAMLGYIWQTEEVVRNFKIVKAL
jgi:thiamine-phosphate pyrophosphorylase